MRYGQHLMDTNSIRKENVDFIINYIRSFRKYRSLTLFFKHIDVGF
jgi:hypothetical protein